jgi:hypothetical protein
MIPEIQRHIDRGGVKNAFDVINKNITTYKYVYRTDIKKFYNSIA